jgi:hypothetical protein
MKCDTLDPSPVGNTNTGKNEERCDVEPVVALVAVNRLAGLFQSGVPELPL